MRYGFFKYIRFWPFLLSLIVTLGITPGFAQSNFHLNGKVTDAGTGDPVPFANVYFEGTSMGTTTDFEGYYVIETTSIGDSLTTSYIGYITRKHVVTTEPNQVINFQLSEDVVNLSEVVIYAGENPAFPIMRNVIRQKDQNDKRTLDAYEYESYTKIEVDVDNLSEKFKQNNSIMRQISTVLDSIKVIAGENGKPILPIFISEAISRFYYKKNPHFRHERVIKTRMRGIGISDGTLVSQVIGSSFQEYNFYQNWLNILQKEFMSPIAGGWRANYDYELVDSLYLGSYYCYRLDIFPKRPQDLAFVGSIWIDKETYALKQIDVTINRKANLNWIEKLKIQQELEPTSAGQWIPVKTRVLVDVGDLTKDIASLLVKFYISTKNVVVNDPQKDSFYRMPVVMEEDVRISNDAYWTKYRHDTLTETEISVYQMIDTLRAIPPVKRMTDMAKFVISGYHKIGPVDLGPWVVAYAANNIEGFRLGFGMRTNIDFSNKWILKGTVGYGFRDEEWKYDGAVEYLINRMPWTKIGVRTRKEVDQIFLLTNDVATNSIFYAYSRFGEMVKPFLTYSNRLYFESQIGTGLNQRFYFKNAYYRPLYDFYYYEDPYAEDPVLIQDMNVSEIGLETRYARDEMFVINDNNRVSLGPTLYPAITFRYALGVENAFASDFAYHKLELEIEKKQKMGTFGTARFQLIGGYVIGQLPYPLLKNHIGNESPFYINFAYNLMDFAEFTSDQYTAFRYQQFFEGRILNRIPLIKKLKLRMIGSANILWGGLRQENLDVIPTVDINGQQVYPFKWLNNGPYVELGYGVENILKIGRIDFFHRLTYLDAPGVRDFGVKLSFQFVL